MQEIGVEEFVRRLRRLLHREGLVAYFLGAGASISSGIPGTGALTARWVKELHQTEAGDGYESFEAWCKARCPEYDEDNPAHSYTTVMRRLFPTQAERQEEIERVVAGHDPGFAYATLAQLMADEKVGDRCNIVLTTNFDDLVADALYLYTRTRPLVVTHEALVSYAAVGRKRPTVIKLHGDAMLEPRNIEDEIAALAPELVAALQRHLQSRALVVIGYGGNDEGVFRALSALPRDTITHGLYWINDELPDNELGQWLRSQPEAFHVRHLDFDELMAIVKTEFGLPNPDEKRFGNLMDRYRETFSELQEKVRSSEEPSSVVARSVEAVRKQFDNWFSVKLEADTFIDSDPRRAEQIYDHGITEFPESAPLLGSYALFLSEVRYDYDRAQELYERAVTNGPTDVATLANYAWFLHRTRHDHDRAQELYERAVAAHPGYAYLLANYAWFLHEIRQDHDRAEDLYERAISANPDHANLLANYAWFLHTIRQDHDRAEDLYVRAISAKPNGAYPLANYAWFLHTIRHDNDGGEELYERAITANPNHAYPLASYAWFLHEVRRDHARAEELYEHAVTANPNYAYALGGYAGLLYSLGRVERARSLVSRAQLSGGYFDHDHAPLRLRLWFFEVANDPLVPDDWRAVVGELRKLLDAGARSRGWSFAVNLERAAEMDKPEQELELLVTLAAVILDETPLSKLDRFSEWRDAPSS